MASQGDSLVGVLPGTARASRMDAAVRGYTTPHNEGPVSLPCVCAVLVSLICIIAATILVR
jgi:hypothetical protein